MNPAARVRAVTGMPAGMLAPGGFEHKGAGAALRISVAERCRSVVVEQEVQTPRHRLGERPGVLEAAEQNPHDRGQGGGQEHSDDAPERSPQNERHERDDRVHVQRLAVDLGLDEIAYRELNGARDRDRQRRGEGRNVGRALIKRTSRRTASL